MLAASLFGMGRRRDGRDWHSAHSHRHRSRRLIRRRPAPSRFLADSYSRKPITIGYVLLAIIAQVPIAKCQ
jgi:hypothetical protein